jgi:hypothetical protein
MSGGIRLPAVLGVISQMTIRASRGTRLLLAAAIAWLGLALCAQAAHATYGKVTIVKINDGGNQSDTFWFHPNLKPPVDDFPLKGGQQQTYQVECNNESQFGSCAKWGYPSLTVTEEQSTPGYHLESIKCVHEQGTGDWPKHEPSSDSQTDGDTTVSGATINLKVNFWEWVKCYVTNKPDSPAIHVVKDGPATAHSGDQLTFSYTVTNPGNVPLTNVTASDDKCSPLTRTGNTSDTTLDPGDTWTYTCSYVIQWSQGDANPVVNTVTTCGMPPGGGDTPGGPSTVCDTDQHSTTMLPPDTPTQAAGTAPSSATSPASGQPPQIAVSPARVRPGSARLSGPTGCPTTSAVAATVTGRRIAKVTFFVDNKKVKTLTHSNASGGRWVLPMNVRRFAFGTHRVRVTVQFASDSQTRARTLRLSFNRCRPAIVTPKFTG